MENKCTNLELNNIKFTQYSLIIINENWFYQVGINHESEKEKRESDRYRICEQAIKQIFVKQQVEVNNQHVFDFSYFLFNKERYK